MNPATPEQPLQGQSAVTPVVITRWPYSLVEQGPLGTNQSCVDAGLAWWHLNPTPSLVEVCPFLALGSCLLLGEQGL